MQREKIFQQKNLSKGKRDLSFRKSQKSLNKITQGEFFEGRSHCKFAIEARKSVFGCHEKFPKKFFFCALVFTIVLAESFTRKRQRIRAQNTQRADDTFRDSSFISLLLLIFL